MARLHRSRAVALVGQRKSIGLVGQQDVGQGSCISKMAWGHKYGDRVQIKDSLPNLLPQTSNILCRAQPLVSS